MLKIIERWLRAQGWAPESESYENGYKAGQKNDIFGYARYGSNAIRYNPFDSFGGYFGRVEVDYALGNFTDADAEAVVAARAAAKAKAEREEAERVVRLGKEEVRRIVERDAAFSTRAMSADPWQDIHDLYSFSDPPPNGLKNPAPERKKPASKMQKAPAKGRKAK